MDAVDGVVEEDGVVARSIDGILRRRIADGDCVLDPATTWLAVC